MIELNLDWREVLWWMQGGMAGSHLRWSVYEDMVNKVWPQCSEEERRCIFLIMRRDLGYYWRPGGWSGMDYDKPGEGPWRDDIIDKTPLEYFRHVLARFNPENQYAITLKCSNSTEYQSLIRLPNSSAVIIRRPTVLPKGDSWESSTMNVTVRAYLWDKEYRVDWSRRCSGTAIVKIERISIP